MKTKKIKWIRYKELASTNDYAKQKRVDGQDLIVTARRQTGGRGTKGRSFSSEVGGVYLTCLRFYQQFPAKRAFEKMASAAVAVCKTLEDFGVKPVIKWANDIHVNGKKICGILTENSFAGEYLQCSVIGMGVNIYNRLPAELDGIATTLLRETGKKIPVRKVIKRLIKHLSIDYPVEEYMDRLGYMGRQVELILGNERVPAALLRVDSDGGLWADVGGDIKRFTAAEVSIKL